MLISISGAAVPRRQRRPPPQDPPPMGSEQCSRFWEYWCETSTKPQVHSRRQDSSMLAISAERVVAKRMRLAQSARLCAFHCVLGYQRRLCEGIDLEGSCVCLDGCAAASEELLSHPPSPEVASGHDLWKVLEALGRSSRAYTRALYIILHSLRRLWDALEACGPPAKVLDTLGALGSPCKVSKPLKGLGNLWKVSDALHVSNALGRSRKLSEGCYGPPTES